MNPTQTKKLLLSLGMDIGAQRFSQENNLIKEQLERRRIKSHDKRLTMKMVGMDREFYYLDIFLFGVTTRIDKTEDSVNIITDLIEKELVLIN
jgi:hypothetical protein